MRVVKYCMSVAALPLWLMMVGCSGGNSVKTVAVSGSVMVDGTALEGVQVHFIGDGVNGIATTDSAGQFVLENGASVGTNKVYFSKLDGADFADEEGMDEGQFEAMMSAEGEAGRRPSIKQRIPREYSDPSNIQLTFDVPADGTTEADFTLSGR